VFATASLFHFTASIQPYGSNFAVAPPGAPAVDGAFEITRFGPAGCVSTWKNQASHCVIRTECNNQSLMEYNIRLICVDKGNERVRHVFGKGSFDPQETFDTLVVCDQCTAEEAENQGPAPAPAMAPPTGPYASFAASADVAKLSASVETLSTEVHELTVNMASNTESVKKLESAVFGVGNSHGAAQMPITAMPIQAGSSQGAVQTPTVAMPIQALGAAAQKPVMVAPTQVEAASSDAAAQMPSTVTPTQALTRRAEGRRTVLSKRRFVKQQETTPFEDQTDQKAGSFTDAQDSSDASGDSQMEDNNQGSVEFVTDSTDQTAEDEEEPESPADEAADSGEDNQDDQE